MKCELFCLSHGDTDCSTCEKDCKELESKYLTPEEIEVHFTQTSQNIAKLRAQISLLQHKINDITETEDSSESSFSLNIPQGANLISYLKSLPLPGDFMTICRDPALAVSFMVQTEMLPIERTCNKCSEIMSPTFNGYLGLTFICYKCYVRENIKTHTFWSGMKLSLDKILLFCFLWVIGLKESEIAGVMDFTQSAVHAICKKIRQKVKEDYLRHFQRFSHVVEMADFNFYKRKIEIGKAKNNEKWVLGLYERDTKSCYLELMPKRKPEFIQKIVQERCNIGTVIVSDQWASYGKLENLGFPHYTWDKLRSFIDEENPNIHTQHLRSIFNWIKYDVKMKHRSSYELQDHIYEWLWRKTFKIDKRNGTIETADMLKSLLRILK
jgi:hypothetical protein